MTGQALAAVHALQHGDWWCCSWEVKAIRKRGARGEGDTSEATHRILPFWSGTLTLRDKLHGDHL